MADDCFVEVQAMSLKKKRRRRHSSFTPIGEDSKSISKALMVQMGEEYYHAKDYNKALTLLKKVTLYYRSERWWTLLTNILITALRCAYLTANVKDYISTTLELASSHTDIQSDEKTRFQMNLLRVVTDDPPDTEHGCDLAAIESAKDLWKTALVRTSDVISIDMKNLAGFIECRTAFDADSFHADEPVSLKVFFRSTGAFPVKFSKLSVIFSNQVYNQYILDTSEKEPPSSLFEDLYLEPGKVKVISFSFVPQSSDVDNKLEIKQVGLHLGSKTILRWDGAGLDALSTTLFDFQTLSKEKLPVSCGKDGNVHWETIQPQPIVDIIPRLPKLTLELKHDPPSLVGEFYRILFEITNTEKEQVENISVNVKVNGSSEEEHITGQLFASIPAASTENGEDNHTAVSFDIEKMLPDEKISRELFLQNAEVGERSIVAEVTYNISVSVGDDITSVNCKCIKVDSINVPIISALSVSMRIASMKLEPIDKVHFDESFFLITNLECTSPWLITILSSELLLAPEFTAVDEEIESQLRLVELAEGDTASECQCLIAPLRNLGSAEVPIGEYILEWTRTASDSEMPPVVTRIPLQSVPIESIPFYVKADIPAYACVRTALPVSYTVYNRTALVQEIEATIEPSESFMFSGNSQVQFRILPNGMHSLSYSMYPLKPGRLALPKLHVTLSRYNMSNMDILAQKMLPTHVFVKHITTKELFERNRNV